MVQYNIAKCNEIKGENMKMNNMIAGTIFALALVGCAESTPSVAGKNASSVTIDGLKYQNQAFTTEHTYDGAKAYCENLSFDGSSNWRVPTTAELHKVASTKIEGPWNNGWTEWFAKNKQHLITNGMGRSHFIKKEFSENMPMVNSSFWTSEEDKENKKFASSVSFNQGVDASEVKTKKNFLMCVSK